MKILIVDDHLLFLDGVSQILSYNMDGVEVVIANSVDDAIEIISKTDDLGLAIIDLMMPKIGGVELLNKIKEIDKYLPVAVLSATNNIQLIKSVYDSGAQGFISKEYSSKKLISAINVILSGDIYIPEEIKVQLDSCAQTQKEFAASHSITGRQLDVLELVAKGLSNQKIAQTLFISEHTVKSHLKQLFKTFNSSNRTSCVNQAKQLGIITEDNIAL